MQLVTLKKLDEYGYLVSARVYDLDKDNERSELRAHAIAGAILAGNDNWRTIIERTGPNGYRESFTAGGTAGRTYP